MRTAISEGGADLVVEIVSLDSQARDRGEKFVEYERAKVEEYWLVDPICREALFYRLTEGVYLPVLPDARDGSTRRPCRASGSGWTGFGIRRS